MKVWLEPRRITVSPWEIAVRIVCASILALVAGGLFLLWSGLDPLAGLSALFRGSFGSGSALFRSLNKAVPIGLCALGIALASRAKLTNVGAEGQFFFGAFAATGVGLSLPDATPTFLAIPAILIAGLIAGFLWASLAAIPRALLGMNEVLSTLMLNYICLLWVSYLVRGPWADPLTYSFPYSPPILAAAQLGPLARPLFGALNSGFIVLIAATALVAAVDRWTRWGYELRVSGDAPRAALYGGINPTAVIVSGLCFAGALAGLAGAIEVSASTGRLQMGLSPGYGFMGILVAWLAGGRALPILFVSIVYAGLLNGGFSLQVSHIPSAISTILQALILLFVLSAVTLSSYRIRFEGGARSS
ncbi:ABC transporter permease [Consotaella aegiceratis]|uniref:ABC transporter permease n=1 Tax=Consotaella aegiceratis TaxID=3097961 RepID=UPI002F3E33CA